MQKKCVHCNSYDLTEGIVQTTDALKLCFVPQDQIAKFLPKTKKLCAFTCNTCGYVEFFIKE